MPRLDFKDALMPMPFERPDTRSGAFVLQALERHKRRREQGIPTLTVLAGPPGVTARLWRHWLDSIHQHTCAVHAASELKVAIEWMESLILRRNLEVDAADFLGATAGIDPGELSARLKEKTAYERDILLQELWPSAPDGYTTAVCRCLLQPQVTHKSAKPFDAVLEACDRDPLRTIEALHALVPRGAAPALLLTASGTQDIARTARVAAKLCADIPTLVIALAVDRPSLDAYLYGSDSKAVAMMREGLIDLTVLSPEALGHMFETLGVNQSEKSSHAANQSREDGVPDEVLTLFAEAAREPQDRARSAEERFLHAFLEAHPATQGLFELNASPGFLLSGRQVEVDLLARQLRIAVEIDGYYHFQGPEAYRRDRRKDLALQSHGFLVLRFLAEDVVARLEEILDTILEVISQRREV